MAKIELKETGSNKVLLIVLSSLVGLLVTVMVGFGLFLFGAVTEAREDRAIFKTNQALINADIEDLQEDDKIQVGLQNQVSKQWSWLGILHDDMNRVRLKEGLEIKDRPQK